MNEQKKEEPCGPLHFIGSGSDSNAAETPIPGNEPYNNEDLNSGAPIASESSVAVAAEPTIQSIVNQKMALLWDKFKESTIERVTELENTIVSLLHGNIREEIALEAQRNAHKLAGSLGTFGKPEGSRIAKQIELIFENGSYQQSNFVYTLSEMAIALRDEVESSHFQPLEQDDDPQKAESEIDAYRYQLLIVDNNDELTEQLVAESTARGWVAQEASGLSAASEYLSQNRPDAVVLNLLCSGEREEGLHLLSELTEANPSIPAIVISPTDSFADRIDVARIGAVGYLAASTPSQNILDSVEEVLEKGRGETTASIVAVDDDPQILELLDAILGPQGINVETLENPEEFWQVLEKVSPDLVLLDLDMPNISGVELCNVMRSDPRWRSVPIVFITAQNNTDTIQKIFQAGADDYIAKPIAGPELIARILNRLERIDTQDHKAKSDPVTGLIRRGNLEDRLSQIFNLADQYKKPASVAVLTIDGLDELSKKHGRDAKNKALKRFGEILQRKFRGQNVAGLWEDNQFLIGIYGASRKEAVNRVSEIIELFEDGSNNIWGPNRNELVLKAGISEYPANGTDINTLYALALEAFSIASSSERQNVVAFNETPDELTNPNDSYDVVLVDDDEVLAELLLYTLETKNYKAHWIKNGHSAVNQLGGDDPEITTRLVLMDVDMPGLSGLNALRQLAGDNFFEKTRVIMLTARAIESETLTALELGAVDFISKPFSIPVLMQRIRRAMES